MTDLSKKQSSAGWFYALLLIILFFVSWFAFNRIVDWFDTHKIQKNTIISVTFKWPVEIQPRETQVIEATQEAKPESANDKVQRLVREKFGIHTPETLLLLQGESGIQDPVTKLWTYRYWAVNQNSGACGLFQALPCEKMPCGLEHKDIECQIDWGFEYIKDKYGTSIGALAFWESRYPHWY